MSNILFKKMMIEKKELQEVIHERDNIGYEDLELEKRYIDCLTKYTDTRHKISSGISSVGGVSARELAEDFDKKPKKPMYATGIAELDNNLLGGLEIGTYVQLAGASGAGKTTMVMEILGNTVKYNKAVLFSFEMGEQRIVKRLKKLFKKDEQWDNLIVDSDNMHITSIISEIRRYAKEGIYWFGIDSMMKVKSDYEDDAIRHSQHVSNELSNICHELDIIVLNINQMSESNIKNGHYAFKGNNAQQYDSDLSLFLVKESNGGRRLYCTKNRMNEVEFDVEIDIN